MSNIELEERLMNIEIALATQERVFEDLNQIVIAQGKQLDMLQKQNKILFSRHSLYHINFDIKNYSSLTLYEYLHP
mgnify:CR=1 FL=1